MALLFLDSFDHYTTSEIADKWTSLSTQYVNVAVAAEGRVGNCLKWTTANAPVVANFDHLRYAPVSIGTTDSGVCGFAIKFTGLGNLEAAGSAYSKRCLFAVWGAHGSAHWNACVNPDGTISLYRNNATGGILLGATGQALREDQWQFVEFEWTLHHTTGTLNVHINGVQSFAYTGDTCANNELGASYTTQWTGVGFFKGYAFGDWYMDPIYQTAVTVRIDDFYLLDASGGVNDAPWGDVTLGYIKPDGVGNKSQWDPSAGSNYACVDDATSDEDSTYVSTSVVNEIDTYTHENVVSGAVIKAVQIIAHTKKGDSGANDLQAVVRISGTDYPTTTTRGVPSNTAYNYLTFPVDESPATTSAWGEAEFNAAEFGPKKVT